MSLAKTSQGGYIIFEVVIALTLLLFALSSIVQAQRTTSYLIKLASQHTAIECDRIECSRVGKARLCSCNNYKYLVIP